MSKMSRQSKIIKAVYAACMVIGTVSYFSENCLSQKYDANRSMQLFFYAERLNAGFNAGADSNMKAKQYLDSSISWDNTNFRAYKLRAEIECLLHMYQCSLNDIDSALSINKDLLNLKTSKAFLLEKLGDQKKANEIYLEVVKEYDHRIKFDSGNTVLLVDQAFVEMFIYGKDYGNNKYNYIFKLHQDDNYVKSCYDHFIYFDRNTFIETFCL